ncbi:hypothetical protein DFJ43DRAFT_1161676 [Lentinula guzmanii]|uniref:WD40 repeat-like protein n=1 Tax=Lentinula guzmanii TaxID=2804957 RepID=A0AA38J5P4_9AGAR|nr:hypothetical protein DFJ43DRAFT_1161676 [Lentinula guzmanii]
MSLSFVYKPLPVNSHPHLILQLGLVLCYFASPSFQENGYSSSSQDGINALAFSEEGKFLAAAGRGGAIIWDLATLSEVTTPSALIQSKTWDAAQSFNTVEWMYFRNKESTHILLLVPIRLSDYSTIAPEEAGDGVISMHVYEREPSQARAYFVVATYGVDYELVAVRFYPRTRDVYLFAAAGGLIACLDKKRSNHFLRRLGPETMGSICVDSTGDRFVKPIVPFPKDAAFTDDGLALVGGTDYGVAAVFDVNSGAMVQT